MGSPVTQQNLQDALATQKREILEDVTRKFDQVTELIHSIETNLLTEFHRYAKGQVHHLHSLDTVSWDVMARVALLETRVLELEGRIRPK